MELLVISLSVLALCLLVLMAGIIRYLFKKQGESEQRSLLFSSQMAKVDLERERERTKQNLQLTMLLDKALALVGTAEPLAFQAVQVMGTPSGGYDDGEQYDPSDEAELQRIADRNPNLGEQGDDVNGLEASFLSDLADAGIDPAAFYSLSDSNGTSPI